MGAKKIAEKIIRGAAKKSKGAVNRAKAAYKKATKKKNLVTESQYTARGSAKPGGKSKYGTKGSKKGWKAFNAKQTGKGAKGKKSILDRNINPIAGKKTIRGAATGIKNLVGWARKNPVDAIVYGTAANWGGKKLGLWGGKGSKNTPEAPKMEKRNYIPKKNKNMTIERTGGPVKAYGGAKAPSMKSSGGLRYVNGKWVR